MSNKLTYPDSNAFSLVASDLRSLWVAGLTYGLHDSEETIKKKQLFADEIRQLLVIISGKDRSYLLWQPRIWTDWEYQEKVIFSFFLSFSMLFSITIISFKSIGSILGKKFKKGKNLQTSVCLC